MLFLCCNSIPEKEKVHAKTFALVDFYKSDKWLDKKVEKIFIGLNPKDRIAQMIVVSAGTNGKPTKTVEKLIQKKVVGGVILLGGEKNQLNKLRHHFDSLAAQQGMLPLLYSADAEPSLINRRFKGTTIVPKTVDLKTIEICDSITEIITDELLSMGIKHNYAPVVDLSPNNVAITNRTFGNDNTTVVKLSNTFISTSQSKGVATTAKHFPGHGLVSGDSHNQLVAIDGEMQELKNYIPLIKNGVISIMVGHIAVLNNDKYNTDGLPSSCSRKIVTDLLKNELGFEGIVITDAMNMGALRKIENASLKAIEAGCDMILMEPDEINLMEIVHRKYLENEAFKNQIDASVKKIIKLKICLGLI